MSKPSDNGSRSVPAPSQPVDVTEGIPDRSPKGGRLRLLLLLLVFVIWIAVLIYIQIAGRR